MKTYGINKLGQTLKEGDRLECGTGLDKWVTHVQFDTETNKWHRQQDYYNGIIIGTYT